ncbi:MAG TPA: sugar ABC transporter ATP-binding protein [Gemmataceae bacterium]|nr:sugar ABC transporter ATP-binding protein [Gemmataceae bacterium]
MSGIIKRFGPTQALAGVDLELRAGEVHALVGENGAGKSTLMKVLSGAIRPDAGHMTLDGQPYAPADPLEARRRGVAMIYQELTLAPHLSVEANITLGLEETRLGFLRRGLHRRRVEEALAVLQHPEIRPDDPVSRLSPAAQQLVEIARALLLDVRVLVLDEPTSSLTREDAVRLFGLIRRLRQRGVAVVYISHFLEEVQEIADRFTVLRDGRSVGGGLVSEFSRERIIELMVGRSLTEQFPRVPHVIGEPLLELHEVEGLELPRGVSLTLHRGEILGIAGIVGAGRTELLRAIFGLDPVRRGRVIVKMVEGSRVRPRQRIAQGVGLLSEDRKAEGLALDQSIADNLTYSRLQPYSRFGWLNLRRRRRAVEDWLARLQVRCDGPEQRVAELSGGNQQKVALGRLLHQQADLLLLDEPTRGVDIGSKAEIYRLIGELAAQGKAVLFVSSYLPELLGVCDRLAVMARGRLSPVRPVGEWTPEQVMAAATGGGDDDKMTR